MEVLGFSIQSIVLSENSESLTSSLTIWISCIYFSFLIDYVRFLRCLLKDTFIFFSLFYSSNGDVLVAPPIAIFVYEATLGMEVIMLWLVEQNVSRR